MAVAWTTLHSPLRRAVRSIEWQLVNVLVYRLTYMRTIQCRVSAKS
jgi:hypothetical protein